MSEVKQDLLVSMARRIILLSCFIFSRRSFTHGIFFLSFSLCQLTFLLLPLTLNRTKSEALSDYRDTVSARPISRWILGNEVALGQFRSAFCLLHLQLRTMNAFQTLAIFLSLSLSVLLAPSPCLSIALYLYFLHSSKFSMWQRFTNDGEQIRYYVFS